MALHMAPATSATPALMPAPVAAIHRATRAAMASDGMALWQSAIQLTAVTPAVAAPHHAPVAPVACLTGVTDHSCRDGRGASSGYGRICYGQYGRNRRSPTNGPVARFPLFMQQQTPLPQALLAATGALLGVLLGCYRVLLGATGCYW